MLEENNWLNFENEYLWCRFFLMDEVILEFKVEIEVEYGVMVFNCKEVM